MLTGPPPKFHGTRDILARAGSNRSNGAVDSGIHVLMEDSS
jgi:hypothetical protein